MTDPVLDQAAARLEAKRARLGIDQTGPGLAAPTPIGDALRCGRRLLAPAAGGHLRGQLHRRRVRPEALGRQARRAAQDCGRDHSGVVVRWFAQIPNKPGGRSKLAVTYAAVTGRRPPKNIATLGLGTWLKAACSRSRWCSPRATARATRPRSRPGTPSSRRFSGRSRGATLEPALQHVGRYEKRRGVVV